MKEVISVVGAGGKTTYIETRAENIAQRENVLVTTTTKMRFPSNLHYQYLLARKEEIEKIGKRKTGNLFPLENVLGISLQKMSREDYTFYKNKVHYANGNYRRKKKKIAKTSRRKRIKASQKGTFIRPKGNIVYFIPHMEESPLGIKFMHAKEQDLVILQKKFPQILLEADGSAGKPFKYPKETEPVIPRITTTTVAILNIEIVGEKVSETLVYNLPGMSEHLFVKEGEKIDVDLLVRWAIHVGGAFKNAIGKKVLCINKTRTKDQHEAMQKISFALKRTGIKVEYMRKIPVASPRKKKK